jgi:hypothetical protein
MFKGANNGFGHLIVGPGTVPRIGSGWTGPDGNGICLEGSDPYTCVITVVDNEVSGNGPAVILGKSRSGAPNGNTQVNNGDVCGTVRFQAANGTDMTSEPAKIQVNVDGTYTPGAAAHVPGRIMLLTSSSSATGVGRMQIGSTGLTVFGNSSGLGLNTAPTSQTNVSVKISPSGGIIFGNNTDDAANRLDDYEEGDWTPALSLSGDTTDFNNGTSGNRAGRYVKIGRTVYVWGFLWNITKANPLTTSGSIQIEGLPFPVSSFYSQPNAGQPGAVVARHQNTSFPVPTGIQATIGTQRLTFFDTQGGGALTEASFLGGTTTGIFEFQLCYTADT